MLEGQFNDYKTSEEAPLGIRIPPEILDAYQEIKQYEAAARSLESGQRRSCQGGFIYGGVFTSLYRGETPRDVDMVVHAPEMVALAKFLDEIKNTQPDSTTHWRDLAEDREMVLSMMFPFSGKLFFNDENMEPPRTSDVLGSCFQMTANYNNDGKSVPLDILFVDQPVSPYSMFVGRKPDAPIRRCAFDLESGDFTFHRHFEEHTRAWKFEPADPSVIPTSDIERAREKGMEIIL